MRRVFICTGLIALLAECSGSVNESEGLTQGSQTTDTEKNKTTEATKRVVSELLSIPMTDAENTIVKGYNNLGF